MTAAAATESTARPSAWWRYDVLVLVISGALLVLGGAAFRVASAPAMVEFRRDGLSFSHPARFLPPTDVQLPSGPGLVFGSSPAPSAPAGVRARFHQSMQSAEFPLVRLETQIAPQPSLRSVPTFLAFERRTRYGQFYWTSDSSSIELAGREWFRARFEYAVSPTPDDAPQIAVGIEYATVNDGRLYVVTVHGPARQAELLARRVQSTLSIGGAP